MRSVNAVLQRSKAADSVDDKGAVIITTGRISSIYPLKGGARRIADYDDCLIRETRCIFYDNCISICRQTWECPYWLEIDPINRILVRRGASCPTCHN
jgi:hypothetical protein